MPAIAVTGYDSIDQVDRGEWDTIVAATSIVNSHAYLSAVEASGINGFRYRYLLFHRAGKLIAHVSVGIFEFGLDVMLQGSAKRLVDRVKRVFPRFLHLKVIECGHPTAIGSTIVVAEPGDLPEVLTHLDIEMEKLARREGTSLLAIRDVFTSDLKAVQPLLTRGYRLAPNLSDTIFRVEQASFEEYLEDLVAKRRHEIRQRIRVFREAGCTVRKVVDFASHAPELERLWRQTFDRAKEYQREILNEAYFRNLSVHLGERSFALLCYQGERIIGFTVLLDSGDTLISTYCGLDYEVNRSTYTYFVLFYRSIEEAIALGKARLELGVTNYNPKIEVGALPEPAFILARSTQPLFNLVFAPLLRMTSTPPRLGMRKIFNSRYYERHRAPDRPSVRIAGRSYRLEDASLGGVGVTGSAPLTRRRHTLTLELAPGSSVRLAVAVRRIEHLGEAGYRIGLQVVAMQGESRLRWQDYVRRHGA